jgi:hypothetical protein
VFVNTLAEVSMGNFEIRGENKNPARGASGRKNKYETDKIFVTTGY